MIYAALFCMPFSIPKYEFAAGTAVRNVVQDLMTPEDASRMAQAFTMPQIRSAAEPEQKLHEYGKAKPTGWNSIQPVGFVVLAN